MKKLTLSLDALEVQSFATADGTPGRGTVQAEQQQCTCLTDCTCPGCPTCAETCPDTCNNTCDDATCFTCGFSCGGSCVISCIGSCPCATDEPGFCS
jgi:hypothetical protein